ncbi:MAG: hypothetical protein K9G41_07680, partial [Flavobacteriales bacterium]|nr:hypothetical protein [Flavobacteriales bacterium]
RHRPVVSGGLGSTPGNPSSDPTPVVAAWIMVDPLGQLRQTVVGLQSAMYHEFQMRAIGAGSPSPWSGSVNGLVA